MGMLGDVVRWSLASGPPRVLAGAGGQDECTQDVGHPAAGDGASSALRHDRGAWLGVSLHQSYV